MELHSNAVASTPRTSDYVGAQGCPEQNDERQPILFPILGDECRRWKMLRNTPADAQLRCGDFDDLFSRSLTLPAQFQGFRLGKNETLIGG